MCAQGISSKISVHVLVNDLEEKTSGALAWFVLTSETWLCKVLIEGQWGEVQHLLIACETRMHFSHE